jgi:hypothetical protein
MKKRERERAWTRMRMCGGPDTAQVKYNQEVARTVAPLAQLLARSRCSHSCSHGRAARTVARTVAPLAQSLAQLPCACSRTLRLRAEGLSIGLLAQLLARSRRSHSCAHSCSHSCSHSSSHSRARTVARSAMRTQLRVRASSIKE